MENANRELVWLRSFSPSSSCLQTPSCLDRVPAWMGASGLGNLTTPSPAWASPYPPPPFFKLLNTCGALNCYIDWNKSNGLQPPVMSTRFQCNIITVIPNQVLILILDFAPGFLMCFHLVWDQCKSQPHQPSASSQSTKQPLELISVAFLAMHHFSNLFVQSCLWKGDFPVKTHCNDSIINPILIGHIWRL